MNPTISRLRDVMNAHDAHAMAQLFSPNYRSEQPAHPERGFGGHDQVEKNWSLMFEGIPDLEVGIVKQSDDGSTSWTEWVMRGTYRDGTPFLTKGVTVAGIEDGLFVWQRLYLEPVEQGGPAIDETVRQLSRTGR